MDEDIVKTQAETDHPSPEQAAPDFYTTPPSHHRLRNGFLISVLVLVLGAIGVGSYAYSITKHQITAKEEQVNIFGQLRRIVSDDAAALRGEEEDRINVLLLGIGGDTHPGGTLTDTIMVASIKPSTQQVALVSLPRDLVVNFAQTENPQAFDYRKINNAFEFGGMSLMQQKAEEVTGLSLHYYILVDFTGFRDVINDLGGIDINVERSFSDYEYPDYNFGYQTIHFEAGRQRFTGEQALQFARSRHGTNGEGSDFARAKRQQKILEAVKDHVFRASTFMNPARLATILHDVGDHVETNMELWEMTRVATLMREIPKENIMNKVIDNSAQGLLHAQIVPETGAYVLIPKKGLGNYKEIQTLVKNVFKKSKAAAEQANVVIQNGTIRAGLAQSYQQLATDAGLNVLAIGNATTATLPTTQIFILGQEAKPQATRVVEKMFATTARVATRPSGESTVRLTTDLDPHVVDLTNLPDTTDLLIVLGADRSMETPQ